MDLLVYGWNEVIKRCIYDRSQDNQHFKFFGERKKANFDKKVDEGNGTVGSETVEIMQSDTQPAKWVQSAVKW